MLHIRQKWLRKDKGGCRDADASKKSVDDSPTISKIPHAQSLKIQFSKGYRDYAEIDITTFC